MPIISVEDPFMKLPGPLLPMLQFHPSVHPFYVPLLHQNPFLPSVPHLINIPNPLPINFLLYPLKNFDSDRKSLHPKKDSLSILFGLHLKEKKFPRRRRLLYTFGVLILLLIIGRFLSNLISASYTASLQKYHKMASNDTKVEPLVYVKAASLNSLPNSLSDNSFDPLFTDLPLQNGEFLFLAFFTFSLNGL